MKRILTTALTLVMTLAVLTGCHGGLTANQNPAKDEHSTDLLNPPVPGQITDLQINSIDKLNYYAAICMITKGSRPNGSSGSASAFAATDETEVPAEPETTAPEETQGPPIVSDPTRPSEPTEDIYRYELDPNQLFYINKVSMFQIELTDENGFLASKLGLGIVDVVITEDFIWDDSLITFRNGEKFFSCLTNGWSRDRETGGWKWDFSTHKYVDGFSIIKDFRQENYAFYIDVDAGGQVTAFQCQSSQNGGHRPDQKVKVASSTVISTERSSFSVAQLEDYLKNLV